MNIPSYDRGRPIGSPRRTDCSLIILPCRA